MSANESRPEAANADLAGGLIFPDSIVFASFEADSDRQAANDD